jgi:hypothetical protein
VHVALARHEVIRVIPLTETVEPGPRFEARKLLPDIWRVNPPGAPAYALDGASREMFGLLEIVTLAIPDWLTSFELVS